MSLPHVDAPSNRRGVVLMGLHRVGSPSSSGLTKQLAPKNRLNRNESSEHVRALSCPPVEVHIAAPMGLPVRVPTPPCSSPSPRKLQSPYESSDAHQALRVTRSWETHQILSEPDKFHEGAVTEAAAGPFKSIPPAVNVNDSPPFHDPPALCRAKVPSALTPNVALL